MVVPVSVIIDHRKYSKCFHLSSAQPIITFDFFFDCVCVKTFSLSIKYETFCNNHVPNIFFIHQTIL